MTQVRNLDLAAALRRSRQGPWPFRCQETDVAPSLTDPQETAQGRLAEWNHQKMTLGCQGQEMAGQQPVP